MVHSFIRIQPSKLVVKTMYLDVEFIRIGTCGGVGVEAGTICVTRRGYTQRIGNGPKLNFFYFFTNFRKFHFFYLKLKFKKKEKIMAESWIPNPIFHIPNSIEKNNLLDI